eukprot:gene1705-1900_t
MTHVRQAYWIPRLRQMVKRIRSNCHGCKKFQAKAYHQPTAGLLPKDRTEGSRSFEVIGVDFAGPITYKVRANTEGKAYILLFACSLTRAVYIEIVTDMTADQFMRSQCKKCCRTGKLLKNVDVDLQCIEIKINLPLEETIVKFMSEKLHRNEPLRNTENELLASKDGKEKDKEHLKEERVPESHSSSESEFATINLKTSKDVIKHFENMSNQAKDDHENNEGDEKIINDIMDSQSDTEILTETKAGSFISVSQPELVCLEDEEMGTFLEPQNVSHQIKLSSKQILSRTLQGVKKKILVVASCIMSAICEGQCYKPKLKKVLKPLNGTLLFLNPLGEARQEIDKITKDWRTFWRNCMKNLNSLEIEWQFVPIAHPKQKDSYNCGIFVLKILMYQAGVAFVEDTMVTTKLFVHRFETRDPNNHDMKRKANQEEKSEQKRNAKPTAKEVKSTAKKPPREHNLKMLKTSSKTRASQCETCKADFKEKGTVRQRFHIGHYGPRPFFRKATNSWHHGTRNYYYCARKDCLLSVKGDICGKDINISEVRNEFLKSDIVLFKHNGLDIDT